MKSEDLIGKRIGHWTVLGVSYTKGNGNVYLKCKCDCGKIKEVFYGNLVRQTTLSCGCEAKKKTSERTKTHGLSKTRLFDIWRGMKQRCYDKKCSGYNHYGSRGIIVCDKWKNDFKTFYDWSMSNGYKDNLTIDRIDVNGNYEPSNCRWTTVKEQARNTRNNRYITYNGETHCLSEWEEIKKLPKGIITSRLSRGYTETEALTVPIQNKCDKGYLKMKKIKNMIVFFLCLVASSCCIKNKGEIPCSTLALVYYDDIQPLEAEVNVLLNNAVIEEICGK